MAFYESQLQPSDIDWFGLCVCVLQGLMDCGLTAFLAVRVEPRCSVVSVMATVVCGRCCPQPKLGVAWVGVVSRRLALVARYDCYPACFIRAVEACGLARKGEGGEFFWANPTNGRSACYPSSPADYLVLFANQLQRRCARLERSLLFVVDSVDCFSGRWCEAMFKRTQNMDYTASDFPVNTHGGLLAFGAPWEARTVG
jgi:hypothetical protein